MKTYELLKKDGLFEDLLIPTQELTKYEDLDFYLKQFNNEIIIKPTSGSRGIGVLRLLKKNDTYFANFNKENISLSECELKKYYNKHLTDKSLIVQPFINSKTIDGSPFDIRVHARKGEHGNFCIHYMPRIENSNRVVSNISTGGYSMDIDVFLKKEFGTLAKNIKSNLKKIGDNFPKYYISLYEGKKIFDLGLDIGILKYESGYKFYLFEVNIYINGYTFELEDAQTALEYYKYLYENHFQHN